MGHLALELNDRFGTRGFALPLALLGLILVSVLMTSVLLSSTAEVSSSGAQQDATRSLYRSAGAIDAYVAANVPRFQAGTVPLGVAATAGDGGTVQTTLLSRTPHPTLAGSTIDVFSLRGEPTGGGRAVLAMVRVSPFQFGIDEAVRVGGGTFDPTGGGTISDGRDSESCSQARRATNAIMHADTTTVAPSNNVTVIGNISNSGMTSAQQIHAALGGMTIREFMRSLVARGWGADKLATYGGNNNGIWPNAPAFTGTGNDVPTSWYSSGGLNLARPGTDRYNWYCPGKMHNAGTNSTKCWEAVGIDTLKNKFQLIDGGNSDVTLQGGHGQGMILVINGGVRINGGFVFRGVIVAENDVDIQGSGNKIEGAILSQNEVRVSRPNDTDSDFSGSVTVRYNACAIDRVIADVNDPGAGASPRVVSRTFGWSEIVR